MVVLGLSESTQYFCRGIIESLAIELMSRSESAVYAVEDLHERQRVNTEEYSGHRDSVTGAPLDAKLVEAGRKRIWRS